MSRLIRRIATGLLILGVSWSVRGLGFSTADAPVNKPPWQRELTGKDARKAEALEQQIDALEAAGKFAEAVQPAAAVLALRREKQGDQHWRTADAARELRGVQQAGRLPQAQQQRLVEAGRCHAEATSFRARGKYADAEPLLRRALALREEVLGPNHALTASSYNNLAFILDAQGKARDAEPLYRKALALREEVLGPKHPDTAQNYNNLAVNLGDQGKHRDAEPLLRRALALREEVLGPKHPDTAHSYNDLAYNLGAQGKARDAEPLYRKALALFEEVLGPKHPDTAASYHNLAYNLSAQGKARDAEPLLRRALALREEVLGPKHPDTAISYDNLASTLGAQGKDRDAEPLHRKALAISKEVLGPKHPDTAISYNNLANNLSAQDKACDAEPLLRKVLALCEEVLGPNHPHTAASRNNLANNLSAQGKARDAEPLLRRALALREEVLGSKHPDTAQSYSNLAANLDGQGKARDAEPLHRKALAIEEEALGPNHPHTAASYHNLAANLDAQGKARDAEAYWRAAVEALEAARLRLAGTGIDRAAATSIAPHSGLALLLARQGAAAEAWRVAEHGLARGLLDDLSTAGFAPQRPEERRRTRAGRLDQLDKDLLPLLTAQRLNDARVRQRGALTQERDQLQQEIAAEAAEDSRREVVSLARLQQQLSPDAALVIWVDVLSGPGATDPGAFHYACVVRSRGAPTWVRLPGRGPGQAWTEADNDLPRRLREKMGHRAPEAAELARAVHAQRLAPLEPHLAATKDLPAVRRLIAVPAGWMAGVPLEALTDRYTVSYAPSGTVFARLATKHRPLRGDSLMALGDPSFVAGAIAAAVSPPHGLLVVQALPGGNAATAGLKDDDVLLRYAGAPLHTMADLKLQESGEPVPVQVWRQGQTHELRVGPGKLGVQLHREPAPVALKQRQETANLLASTRGSVATPLPGSRREVTAVAAHFPKEQTEILLGSDASEQRLDALAAAGRLKEFRVLHFATHGEMDPVSAWHSVLLMANDRLPDELDQVRKGAKRYTGRMTVQAVNEWKLDADLVVLSACETGLGKYAGGDGYLGFAQVLFKAGARSLVLSLWKVDDDATALLMKRFYENLLGKRGGPSGPLSRAEALREAKQWLRSLDAREAEKMAQDLPGGQRTGKTAVPADARLKGDRPYEHPYYWAAFILIGDPD